MAELTSRITNADDAARTAAETAHGDANTIIDRLENLRHSLGWDDDVTQADVFNAINNLSDRMASYFETMLANHTALMDFLDLMNTNAASNARLTIGGINAIGCCDFTITEAYDVTPDGDACQRAGFGLDTAKAILNSIYSQRSHGVLVSSGMIGSIVKAEWEAATTARLKTPPSDYTTLLAQEVNAAFDTTAGGIALLLEGELGDQVKNIIGTATSITDALNSLSIAYFAYPLSTEQIKVLKALINGLFLADVYDGDFTFSTYPDDCTPYVEYDHDCVGGASSAWGGHFTVADTHYPMGSFSGNKRWHWTNPSAPGGQVITVYNHDDSDSVVGTAVEDQVLHLLDGVNYYWSAATADGSTTYTYCVKADSA